MYCSKCGNEVKKEKYCPKCGNFVNEQDGEGSITFYREKQFYGVLVPIDVFLDGEKVCSVKADEQIKVPVTIGKHKLAFNLWSGNGIFDIEINENNPKVKVTFKLSMGLVTSKPKIVSIESIK